MNVEALHNLNVGGLSVIPLLDDQPHCNSVVSGGPTVVALFGMGPISRGNYQF